MKTYNPEESLTVTLTPKKGGYTYGSGTLLDMLASSLDLPTSEPDEYTADQVFDSIRYVWRENAETYIRDGLNELDPSDAACEVEKLTDRVCDLKNTDVLPGDVLAIQYPTEMQAVKGAINPQDIIQGDDYPAWLPKAARKDLEAAETETTDEIYREWLHGDYRSWDGILKEITRKMFSKYSDAEIEYDEKTDTLTITAQLDEWAGYLGEIWEDEGSISRVPSMAELEKSVLRTIEYNAKAQADEAKAKTEQARAESERVKCYQAEQKKEKDAALLEEAKARKREKMKS